MNKKALGTIVKRSLSILLSLAMIVGLMPSFVRSAKAADNDPYVVSKGRMTYASSSQANSDSNLAVDGDEATRWESTWDNATEWYYVDLGKVTQVTSLRILWEGAYASKYNIQFSDDEQNWNTVFTENNSNGGEDNIAVTGNTRYVRINMQQKFLPAYGYSMFEFQVYGLNGLTERPVDYGTNLALNKTATASSLRDVWWMYDANGVINQTNVLASNAVDGKANTSWTSGEADKQSITVDLGANYTIGRVIINWTNDAGKIYDLQVSTDNASWTTVYRQLKGYGQAVANIELHNQARYVRVYGYTRVENGSGFSISELEVYPYRNGDPIVTHDIEPLPEMQIINSSNGKGSYVTQAMYLEKAKLPTYAADNITVPIESNDWWQSSVINKFGNLACILPLKAKYSTKGLSVLTATDGWLPTPGPTDVNISVQSETVPDLTIMPENLDALTACDIVSGYSDYAVNLDLKDKNGIQMKSTFVKGSPYIFTEFPNGMSAFISGSSITRIFGDNNNDLFTNGNTTITADHIGIEVIDTDNKEKTKNSTSYYCITVPAGTVFKQMGSYVKVIFPAAGGYMSIGSMTDKSQLNTFYQHGYAFVSDTSVTYNYDESYSNITVNYQVTTQVKRGGFSNQTIQCLLPHQWKDSTADNNSFATYKSVRGDLKAVIGNLFTTTDTFAGLVPIFSKPDNAEFNSNDLLSYLGILDDATKNLNPAADAYWEGKNLHPLGMGVLMADQIGETELRDVFLARMKKILVNWFTYDGENDPCYFIYDEKWGTLYYLQSEFGANTAICDHHFTYGYFMFAATVLATYDAEFYNDYKSMIELLIRDYANPSDNDPDYCRFRSYDLYEGHSWAGGYADNDSGNNQESASESLFSWVSLYLWGVLTQNDSYRDAGIFGFTNEMDAVKEYWFDYDLENWIDDWPYEVVGQVYGGINFYGTFFGGQPLYIYGIQWLPISEYLTYYGENQQRAADIYAALLAETDIAMQKAEAHDRAAGKTEAEIRQLLDTYPQTDTGWQHIAWPFLSQTNPQLALSKFNNNVSAVQRTDTALTYWFINSMLKLGVRTENIVATGDVCASVYHNNNTGKYTAVVWNPTNETKTVRFRNANGEVGSAVIGSKALVDFEVSENGHFEIAQTATPVISVPSGTYDDTQFVEISAPTAGSVIYYTTDGSTPTRSSKVYDGMFAVSSDTVVKAIAVKDGYIDSTTASSTIVIGGTEISYDVNLAFQKNVTVSSYEDGGTNGNLMVDGLHNTRWSSGFTDNEWAVVDLGQVYAINKITLDWEASYATAYNIQVSTDNNNWTTVYEKNNGRGGEEVITIDAVSARYVKLQGVKRALNYGYSLWEIGVYEAARVADPVFSLPSGTYEGAQTIAITSATKGVEIRYTLDGSTPNENSLLYVPGLKLRQSATLKAVAYKKGMLTSGVAQASYVLNNVQDEPETQPQTQPETQPQTQPETQPQTQPETQPQTQPETQPQTQPETQAPGALTTIHIEAEDYASVTGGVSVGTKRYEDSQYITGFAKGDSATYNVTVTDGGTCTVDLRASIKYAGTKKVNVYVDGTLATTVDIESTGSFASFQTFESPVIYLAAGNHTLKLEAAGAAGYAINWIELKGASAPETQPETQPQGTTTTVHIEAEDFASVTGGVAVGTKKYEDSQYITGFAKGDSATYNVTVAGSGEYAVDIRASIKYAGTKTVNVYVDGVLATTVNIESTGSFATFQTFEGEQVYLTAGNHTLKLEAAGAAGYAINWIELKGNTEAPETQPETLPQGPTETVHIEAEDFASVTGGVSIGTKTYEDSQYITGFAKGDSAIYNITTTGSGSYKVDIRASIKYAGTKKVNVYVDGALITTVDIESTGSFASFQTFESPTVYLTAGNHELKLEAAGAAGYAINWIELKGNTVAPETQPETPAIDNDIDFGADDAFAVLGY
ncbi:MAG: discoidin domain-containing protein [Lachnospiraceae bacterium]|nr:discoidin domain-containing protein [Lachnospiraceae bacterium]